MVKAVWRYAIAAILAVVTSAFVSQGSSSAQTSAPTVTSVSPSSGPVGGGTQVTVNGSGFLGPNNQCASNETVYFGADPQDNYWIPATNVQILSDTQMVATTPQDYGGEVGTLVHNACGLSSSLPWQAPFTYTYANDDQCQSGTCTLSVNGNSDLGPVRHSAEGFLNGYNIDNGDVIPPNVPSQIDALHPTAWRLGGNTEPAGTFDLAKGSGAQVTALFETDWNNHEASSSPGSTLPLPPPWTQLTALQAYAQLDVTTRELDKTAPDYWDVWNEPDGSGTVSQWLSVYKAVYQGMKAADPNVKVVGPSIGVALTSVPGATGNSSGADLDIATFANFAKTNNLNFAAVTYHDEGEPPPADWPNGPRPNYTPAALGADVGKIRSTLASAGLSGTQVFVNEYGPTFAILEPGWTVGSFASLEGASVDQANLTCADSGACNNLMDGLFTSSGTPQMPYWVMRDYAQMTGERLATSGSGTNITALATKTDSAQQVQVLVGRHDECGPPPRAWVGSGIPNNTCPQFQAPKDSPVPTTVAVAEPYALSMVKATISPLPNSATQPDGSDPVPTPPASSTMTLPVTNGTVTVPLSSVGDGDAVSITITPPPPEPYHPLTPARITDTRSGSGFPNQGMTLHSGQTLDVQVAGAGGVPGSGVTAAVLNVTATNPTEQSDLTVWPTGAPRPFASNLNFVAGESVPNLVEVGLGSSGQVSVYNPTGSVDVVVDVEGYAGPSATAGTGLYNPLTPARITDTRTNSAFPNAGKTLGPGSTLNVQVTGAGGVPLTGVSAAVLNVTATNPTEQSYLTVWPTGAPRPFASNLNFAPGQTVPNRVQVPVGSDGQVSIYNPAGSVDVVVDVGGYFTDNSNASATGSQFSPTVPARITDTRSASGYPNTGDTLGAGGTIKVQVSGAGLVPSSDVTAAVLNVTSTNTMEQSYLTVWPDGVAQPQISDLNPMAGQTIPNLVVVKLGSDGAVDIYNAAGSVDVVVDVTGWYS